MRLADFLKTEAGKRDGLSLRAIARKARLNEATVWRAAKGKGIRLDSAIKISRATKNKVRIEDLQQKELDL